MIKLTKKYHNIKNIIKILLSVSFYFYGFFDAKWIFFYYYVIFEHFFEILKYNF